MEIDNRNVEMLIFHLPTLNNITEVEVGEVQSTLNQKIGSKSSRTIDFVSRFILLINLSSKFVLSIIITNLDDLKNCYILCKKEDIEKAEEAVDSMKIPSHSLPLLHYPQSKQGESKPQSCTFASR
jgi:hypothetical protein